MNYKSVTTFYSDILPQHPGKYYELIWALFYLFEFDKSWFESLWGSHD
ncbi:MAG: hypothetical protein M1326_10375 [Cyanobacteria bacterium]|nr:hypothetical protein [Cyanobacteriota bacterium]